MYFIFARTFDIVRSFLYLVFFFFVCVCVCVCLVADRQLKTDLSDLRLAESL